MNRKIGFWVVVWAILVVVTGFLAFGYGPYDREYGARGGWGHMRGWDNGCGAEVGPGGYGRGPGRMGGGESGYAWGADRYSGMTAPFGMSGGAYGMMGRSGGLDNGPAFTVFNVKVGEGAAVAEKLPERLAFIAPLNPQQAGNFRTPRTFSVTAGRMQWGLNGRVF